MLIKFILIIILMLLFQVIYAPIDIPIFTLNINSIVNLHEYKVLIFSIFIILLISLISLFYSHCELKRYIIKLKLQEKKLKYLTIIDSLSGLYNRHYFDEVISSEFDRAKRKNNKLTFALLDIDFFKKYNDNYGHQEGDKVIKEVSKVLMNYTKRSGDFAFRVGGEEFAIILQSADLSECKNYFDEICKSVEELCIKHIDNTDNEYVTISIGVTNITNYSNLTVDELYKYTDEQLYYAKENGRNKTILSTI